MRDLATHESGVLIDLAEPTFDQEILLKALLAERAERGRMREGALRCETHKAALYLKERPRDGVVFACHWPGTGVGKHRVSLMSTEHRIQAAYVARAGDRAGLDVDFEVSLPTHVRPDVVIGGNTAIEVQRSHLTVGLAKSRTIKALNGGMAVSLWISDKEPKYAPKWMYQVPSATAFARDWNTMPPLGSATVTGGLRELVPEPCRPPYRWQCPENDGRYCGKQHVIHRPLLGVSLDALTVGVATGEYLAALIRGDVLIARETDVHRFDAAWLPPITAAVKQTPSDERVECRSMAPQEFELVEPPPAPPVVARERPAWHWRCAICSDRGSADSSALADAQWNAHYLTRHQRGQKN